MPDIEKNTPSPCVSICALDEDDICVGCYRSADEIRQWRNLSNKDKKQVLDIARERERKVNPFL